MTSAWDFMYPNPRIHNSTWELHSAPAAGQRNPSALWRVGVSLVFTLIISSRRKLVSDTLSSCAAPDEINQHLIYSAYLCATVKQPVKAGEKPAWPLV